MSEEFAIMEQRPAESALHQSSLAAVDKSGIEGPAAISLMETGDSGHLVLRGVPDVLEGPVKTVIDLELPMKPLTSASDENSCIRWVSPDEWLLTVPGPRTFSMESGLRNAILGHAAIVNVSGGQTILHLSGEHAIIVLMKSTGYDVHENNFPPGKVVTTTLGQAQTLMRRITTDQFELVIRRSFADYIWAWLRDAAREFGVKSVT